MKWRAFSGVALILLALNFPAPPLGAETIRVATFNLENYLEHPTAARPRGKSAASRAKARESIRALRPDVLALEEVGDEAALRELRGSLAAEGLSFPFWEFVRGFDTNAHVAVLSRFPISARRAHTNETYVLGRRRFHVSRGIADVDIRVSPVFSFTLLAVHLKSQRPVPEADQAEERLREARILRRLVDRDLASNPRARLVVLGDFNDSRDSEPVKAIIGRGRFKLTDTRPAERNGDNAPNPVPAFEPRNVVWTHYYGKSDVYSRLDYILVSPGLKRDWLPSETYVLALPNWGVASDHRPLVAAFEMEGGSPGNGFSGALK